MQVTPTPEKKLVLIVEDEKLLCTLMVGKFESSGFETRGVFDGNEALKALSERRPACILLDLLLPGIDGFEILRRVKTDSRYKDIPILVFSNLSEPDDIKKAKDLGAAEYIIKTDYSPKQIVEKVAPYCTS